MAIITPQIIELRALEVGKVFLMGRSDRKVYAIKVMFNNIPHWVNLTEMPVQQGPSNFRLFGAGGGGGSEFVFSTEEKLNFVPCLSKENIFYEDDTTYQPRPGDLLYTKANRYLLIYLYDQYSSFDIGYLDLSDHNVYHQAVDKGYVVNRWELGIGKDQDFLPVISRH